MENLKQALYSVIDTMEVNSLQDDENKMRLYGIIDLLDDYEYKNNYFSQNDLSIQLSMIEYIKENLI